MIVRLTSSEIMQGAICGITRRIKSIEQNRRPKYGIKPGTEWQVDIEGALGELAVAKALRFYWPATIDTFKREADIGAHVEIRTRSERWHDLMVHDEDADDRIFILCRGRAPEYDVAGWIRAREGKRSEFWKDPAGERPAYFVGAEHLNDLEQLRAAVLAGARY